MAVLKKALLQAQKKIHENKQKHVKVKMEGPKKKLVKPKSKVDRGVVYLGHLPHGFYEDQMKEYFSQFGQVTRVRVARSKKNAKSRGYAYVEFANTDVAKIAANSMNNYLMGSRLVKAQYIPPAEQKLSFFMGDAWTKDSNPTIINRRESIKRNRAVTSNKMIAKKARKSLSRLETIRQKLQDKGIDVEFKPVKVSTKL